MSDKPTYPLVVNGKPNWQETARGHRLTLPNKRHLTVDIDGLCLHDDGRRIERHQSYNSIEGWKEQRDALALHLIQRECAASNTVPDSWDSFEFNVKDEGDQAFVMQLDDTGYTRGILRSMRIPWEYAEPIGQWLIDRAKQRRLAAEADDA